VIGAGVVGLACARALALRGIETVILEANAAIGLETSSRNSEVIHAGLYYPPARSRLACAWQATACSTNSARHGMSPIAAAAS
jgi:L-2-hydroxyglutarate oxidase LhgO